MSAPGIPARRRPPRRPGPGRPGAPGSRLAAPLGALAAAAAVLTALFAGAAVPPPAAAAIHQEGEKVEVTGVVTGKDGVPVPGVRVVLEASRTQFSLRSFSQETKDATRLTALTDARGQYTLSWPWNSYYNSFELLVGVPVRKPGGEKLHVLEKVDLTRRIRKAGPVVATVVVDNVDFVRKLKAFVASVDTDDERRVYEREGKPDEVKQQVWSDGSGRVDAGWWYFASGRVYRFQDGVLTGVESFDPVREF